MAQKIEFEAFYPFAPDEVWVALTDSKAMDDWLMPNDFEPVIGHRFNFRTKPAPGFDGVVYCEVLELEAPRRVAYSWRGGGIDTIVSFSLAPAAGGTRMTMEQSGFTGLRGAIIKLMLKSGWKRMIEVRLRAAAACVKDGVYAADGLVPGCDTGARRSFD